MSYARHIDKTCEHAGCAKRATHQVFNRQNAPMGFFCFDHVEKRVAELGEAEEKYDRAQTGSAG